MPIIQPQVPSKTQAFGNLFGGMMEGVVKGAMLKKQQAQDDAMKIWQMAQTDPLLLENPQAKRIFDLAGWPVPTQARNKLEDALILSRIEQPIPMATSEGTVLYFPRTGQIKTAADLSSNAPAVGAGPQGQGLSAGGASVNPAAVARSAGSGPDFGVLANQWLQPDQFTGFLPPAPAVPQAPGFWSRARAALPAAMSAMAGVPRLARRSQPTVKPAPTVQPRLAPTSQPRAGAVAPLLPFDIVELAKKLDPASKEQLIQIIKEGDPKKMQAAYERMKATYGSPVR